MDDKTWHTAYRYIIRQGLELDMDVPTPRRLGDANVSILDVLQLRAVASNGGQEKGGITSGGHMASFFVRFHCVMLVFQPSSLAEIVNPGCYRY